MADSTLTPPPSDQQPSSSLSSFSTQDAKNEITRLWQATNAVSKQAKSVLKRTEKMENLVLFGFLIILVMVVTLFVTVFGIAISVWLDWKNSNDTLIETVQTHYVAPQNTISRLTP